jgi:hypothetical protein
MQIPNLFIIGAPRCGTRAIKNYLNCHPDIFVPNIDEPGYFERKIIYDFKEDYKFSRLKEYLKLFNPVQKTKKKYYLDATAMAMYSEKSIINILRLNKNAKFIIMMRDPLEASKSMYKKRLSIAFQPLREINHDFYECWETLEKRKKGLGYPENCRSKLYFRYDLLYSYDKYIHYINKLIKPQNRVYINFKTLSSNPQKVKDYLLQFLEIDNIFLPLVKSNEGTIIYDNKFISIVDNVIMKTLNIRKKYNIVGNKLSVFKNLYHSYKKKISKNLISDANKDKKIKIFFFKAYEVLKKDCNI